MLILIYFLIFPGNAWVLFAVKWVHDDVWYLYLIPLIFGTVVSLSTAYFACLETIRLRNYKFKFTCTNLVRMIILRDIQQIIVDNIIDFQPCGAWSFSGDGWNVIH